MEAKYFNKNLCYCGDCIFNSNRHCLCYREDMIKDEKNNCAVYRPKNTIGQMTGEEIRAIVGGDTIKLPVHLVKGCANEQTRSGKKKIEVKLEHPYVNHHSVTYTVRDRKAHSSVYNADIVNEEIKRRDKEWKSQVRRMQRLGGKPTA